MWTASEMGSFWFPFHTWAMSEITFPCPFSGTGFSVLWIVVQEESLLFQPRSAHVESGASRRQQYPPLLRLGQTWQLAWILSLAKVKIRQISEFIRFAMKNNLTGLSFSQRLLLPFPYHVARNFKCASPPELGERRVCDWRQLLETPQMGVGVGGRGIQY